MSKNIVTVYSAKWCGACGPFKESLKKAGIEFKEVDMDDENATKEAFKLGIRNLPTTTVHAPDGTLLLIQAGSGAIPLIKKYL